MRSLAAHLRDPDSHDALPFHPSCPICRETRLTGPLPTAELVPKRTQAMLAAGVLAVSALGPAAAAVAAEQDQQQDGTADVGQSAPADSADSPDFDPGGDASDLPDTSSLTPQTQAPADPSSDDTGPVDQTPVADTADPVVDPGDTSGQTPVAEPSPAPTAPEPAASTPAPTEIPTPSMGTPPTTTVTPTPAPATERAAEPERATPPAEPTTRSERHTHAEHPQVTAQVTDTVAPAPIGAAPGVAAPTVSLAATASAQEHSAKPGDRTHTVVAGESLWAIASDILGGDPSPAEIAREVHRLWQLNSDRIGSGDPDLLPVGTRLSLR